MSETEEVAKEWPRFNQLLGETDLYHKFEKKEPNKTKRRKRPKNISQDHGMSKEPLEKQSRLNYESESIFNRKVQ